MQVRHSPGIPATQATTTREGRTLDEHYRVKRLGYPWTGRASRGEVRLRGHSLPATHAEYEKGNWKDDV
jgi:hypothetical protein